MRTYQLTDKYNLFEYHKKTISQLISLDPHAVKLEVACGRLKLSSRAKYVLSKKVEKQSNKYREEYHVVGDTLKGALTNYRTLLQV